MFKDVTNTLKERVFILIDKVYYDSWGGTYSQNPESYLKIHQLSKNEICEKSVSRCLGFEIIDNRLALFEISCSYDENQVFFRKDILTSFYYDKGLHELREFGDKVIYNEGEIIFGLDEKRRYVTNLIINENYYKELAKEDIIILDDITLDNLFRIYKENQNSLIPILLEKKLYNTLLILLNNKIGFTPKSSDKYESIIPIICSLESINYEKLTIFNSSFKDNRHRLPNLLNTVSRLIITFGSQNTQSICNFIEVFYKIGIEKKESWQSYDKYTTNPFIIMVDILESLLIIGLNNQDITGILNYVVKSIFNSYQCKLELKEIKSFLKLYQDYVNMYNDFQGDDNLELYPIFLKKSHDDLIAIYNNKNEFRKFTLNEKYSFMQNTQNAKVYEFETDKYIVKVPNSQYEIINEGKSLNHCVGGYSFLVANGMTNILFVRYKVEESTPYMTIEIKDNTIVQAKKKWNRKPASEDKIFINEYALKMGLTIREY